MTDVQTLEKENRRLQEAVDRLYRTVQAQRERLNERVPVNLDTNANREGIEDALRRGLEAHLDQHRGLILESHVEELTVRLLGELKELNRACRASEDEDGADGEESLQAA